MLESLGNAPRRIINNTVFFDILNHFQKDGKHATTVIVKKFDFWLKKRWYSFFIPFMSNEIANLSLIHFISEIRTLFRDFKYSTTKKGLAIYNFSLSVFRALQQKLFRRNSGITGDVDNSYRLGGVLNTVFKHNIYLLTVFVIVWETTVWNSGKGP